MAYLEYKLLPEGFINRFAVTGVFAKDNPMPKTTLSGKVNEWLTKGLSVYDNPGRVKSLESRSQNIPPYVDLSNMLPGDSISVFEQTTKVSVYFPFESDRISNSGFFESPAYLRSYGYTLLEAPKAENTAFKISTCGGLTIWLNDELVTDFIPFTRNVEQSTTVSIQLKAGINKIAVCLEDLAERDTDFFCKIQYLGMQELAMKLYVADDTDIEAVKQAEYALSQMYFEKECFKDEPAILKMKSFTRVPIEMTVIPEKSVPKKTYIISPEQTELVLFNSNTIASSFIYFMLEITVSGLVIRKKIGTFSYNTKYEGFDGDTYAERKQKVWDAISNNPKKTSDYKALLKLHEGEIPDNLQEIFDGHLGWVNPKRDCSDFRMIILVYLYGKFKDKLPDKLRSDIEEAFLNYRYWIDEPGDDVMWFFSENHALMFHVSQYFAGQYLPEQVFVTSGLTGAEASKKAEKLLHEWFDSFFSEFATEWNSSTYIPIDIMGLAYLYAMEPKGKPLHDKAKKGLDMLAYSLAVNEHKGNIMSSFGRTYEKELKGSFATGMPSILYLWYNAGHMNPHFRALTPLVASDYEPPKEYQQYTNLVNDEELIHENTQGMDQFVNLYLYKNAKVLLSTAVNAHPYEQGYQESVLQATIDGTAQVWVNHPGEAEVYGSGRPGFWAGNGCLPFAAQYENVSIAEFHLPADCRVNYTHAYAPLMEFNTYKLSEKAIALEKDGSYIGIRTLNGLSLRGEGPCRDRELISPGQDNVWVVKVGRNGEYQNVDQLLREMEQIEITLDGREGSVVTNKENSYVLKNRALYVNGRAVHNYPLDVAGRLTLKGGRWN